MDDAPSGKNVLAQTDGDVTDDHDDTIIQFDDLTATPNPLEQLVVAPGVQR